MATTSSRPPNQKIQKPGRGGRRPGAGRPSGVGNRATPEDKRTLAELAKVYAPAALQVLVDVARDTSAPASSRVAAASALLDRSHGRPVQALEHTGKDGGPIETADIAMLSPVEREQRLLAVQQALAVIGAPGGAQRRGNGHAGNGANGHG